MNKKELVEVILNGRVIVPECPYCGKTHVHSVNLGMRQSDCFPGGEYLLIEEEETGKRNR